jgi:hypothetical protein
MAQMILRNSLDGESMACNTSAPSIAILFFEQKRIRIKNGNQTIPVFNSCHWSKSLPSSAATAEYGHPR